MPKDNSGKYHMNGQRAKSADKKKAPGAMAEPKNEPKMDAPKDSKDGGDQPFMSHFDHGDGSGHTETSDGGYHDHGNIEALKAHMGQFLDEEGKESSPPMEDGKGKMPMHGGGGHDMSGLY